MSYLHVIVWSIAEALSLPYLARLRYLISLTHVGPTVINLGGKMQYLRQNLRFRLRTSLSTPTTDYQRIRDSNF